MLFQIKKLTLLLVENPMDYSLTGSHPVHSAMLEFYQRLSSSESVLTCIVVIYKALCVNVAQGRMNGAPNKTQTHSCRFASLSLLTVTPPEVPVLTCIVMNYKLE